MSSLNNRHQITVNLPKLSNLSSAICSPHLTWKYLPWWILHVAVFIKKYFCENLCCEWFNFAPMTHLLQYMYLQRMLKWVVHSVSNSVLRLTVTSGLLSFSLRKFLQAHSGSSQFLPINQTLLLWVRVPKCHMNGRWTAVVENHDLICKDQRPWVKVAELLWK